MFQVYESEELLHGVYRITERPAENAPGVNMYVVVGQERALLFDTGFGVTDTLPAFVAGLTDKPIVCVVGHGHPDHAGAAALFDEVYMNHRDEGLLPVALSYERRMDDVFGRLEHPDPELKAYCETHIVLTDRLHYKDIDQGDTVDLGGQVLEVYAIPGHTNGSIALLNRAGNYALVSDAFSTRTALVTLPPEKRVGLTAYRDGLARFLDAIGEDTLLYWGHGNDPVNHDIPRDMLRACTEVLDGQTEQDVASVSHFAKRKAAATKRMMEHKCGSVLLVYDANTL
ncbi:MAG: MBL fold metallo-hydrolase [Clostridiales bacterium]|nr:MBL fold metallo-hydrolase [Clostridiales bacterium]